MFIERFISTIGVEVSPNINYWTLLPRSDSITKILLEKRGVGLSNTALPILILSIILLVPMGFYILHDTPYSYYMGARAILLSFNLCVWYCCRTKTRLFSKYVCLVIYIIQAAFIFYFPELEK